MINLNYLMDRVLYQIFKTIWSVLKKHGENSDKPSVQIYVNKLENSVACKIKDGYALELLTPKTMKLLGSTENKITKDKTVKMYHILKLQK